MYNSDIDIVIYTHIHAYRCTPVDAEPSIHARIYIHPYAHARGYGCRQTHMEPPMCVCACASGHPYKPRGTSVHAHWYRWACHSCARAHTRAHAHAPMECTRTLIHIHVLIHTYVDVWGAREYRFRHSCAHVRTRKYACMESTRTHTCIYMHSHIHIHTW